MIQTVNVPTSSVLYVVKNFQKGNELSEKQLYDSPLPSSAKLIEKTVQLGLNDGPILIVPAAHNPGETGNFNLTVFSRNGEGFKLTRIN